MRETSLATLLDKLPLQDGLTVSFHHHLRDGDAVMNMVLEALKERGLKDIHLSASALFPVHTAAAEAIREGRIKDVTTNYMNGPAASLVSKGYLAGGIVMQTHGGRARSLINKERPVDIAFLAASAIDRDGNATGSFGKNPFGSMGYAVEDAKHAAVTVIVTDTVLDKTLSEPEISAQDIDHHLVVAAIGDAKGIMSGTLEVTKDPVGKRIARDAVRLLDALGVFQDGVSFQSGAGGVSLAITEGFNRILEERKLTASFFSGGITRYHVEALEKGLVERLYDVQCFDDAAVESLAKNERHIAISASRYANPENTGRIIKDLDVVILGASQIDRDFNVNVTTDSYGKIIGGSGGHADTAEDAKLSVIVGPLFRGRTPLIADRVRTITTPGRDVDCLVTERGIAIHPSRKDLMEILCEKGFPFYSIEELQEISHRFTGRPVEAERKERIGYVESRHKEELDSLHKIKEE